MQIPPSVHSGDLLEIRRQRWRVLDVHAYEYCQLVAVTGIGATNAGVQRRFLAPFDAMAPVDRARAPRFVGPRRWRHACRGLLAACTPGGGLRAAAPARIDLFPHQLEPALALVSGRGSRFLLADDVGMGKTIQAGLIIAELQARGQADRVLIVTPSGLRDQWRGELAERFGIAAAVVDFRESRRRTATVAVGVNPWVTAPIAITSIDYLKRREILQSVRACRWDVLVVDEAHGAGRDSERLAAVSALAAQAAFVVLLTATPHNGDPLAFASLCRIGALDDPLLVFRRARGELRPRAGRRLHQLHVRSSAAESRMHALLAEFTRAVRSEHDFSDAWLALSVLHKRAFSSARSLELTVRRRLDTLGPEATGGLRQLTLPLNDLAGELDEADDPPDCLAAVGLADAGRERLLLVALGDAARRAVDGETKVLALRRLLRRVAEPVVVFTEFRDTLLHLRSALNQPVLMLHGGLTREERRGTLEDFFHGRCRILLATDAAGEGLNLHHRCRLVVNLELPWNPIRLEQRIGRVDRIGQARTVHAVHLIARHTGESRVLARLKARIARAREDIAAANPIEDEERAVGRAVIDPHGRKPLVVDPGPVAGDPGAGAGEEVRQRGCERAVIDLGSESRAEAARLESVRGLFSDAGIRALAELDVTGPWVTRARLRQSRVRLGRRAIVLLRIDREDGYGRLFDWTLIAVSLALSNGETPGRERVRALLHRLGPDLQSHAEEAGRRSRAMAGGPGDPILSIRLHRERQAAQLRPGAPPSTLQPGLFDRRADRAHLADLLAARASATGDAERLRALEAGAVVSPRPARILLVVVP